MRGVIADVNIEGHVARLVDHILATGWADFWHHLGLSLVEFSDLGMVGNTPDAEVWRTCQREQLVLITNNRNNDGPDSLEATIRAENDMNSLPVLTVGDAEDLRTSTEYAERVAARLIDILIDIDAVRGSGRLYLP